MDVVVTLGKIFGVVGVCLGIFLVIFRDVVRKKIFPRLPPEEAFKLLRLALVLTWSIAFFGLAIWAFPKVVAIGSGIHVEVQG